MYNSNPPSFFLFKVVTFGSVPVANFVKAEGSMFSQESAVFTDTHTHTVALSKWRFQQLQ